jgi:DNA-binding beta-propeller fold protein YncE
LAQWGSAGSGNGQFNIPFAITVSGAQEVYVTEEVNQRVQVFDTSGNFLRKWGEFGAGPGQFNRPHGVAVDLFDNVFVIEAQGQRIQKFLSDGTYVSQWGIKGEEPGSFIDPQDVQVDTDGFVYALDWNGHPHGGRVQKFSNDGSEVILFWGTYEGSDPGEFIMPYGLAVPSDGTFFIADTFNSRVEKFGFTIVSSPDLQLRSWGRIKSHFR